MTEIWKPIKGYDGYEVSNLGRIRSYIKYGNNGGDYHLLKAANKGDGYFRVCLCVKGMKKNVYVHRIVAETFIDNPFGYPQVNHKDEDKSNNAVTNLEWCSAEYNKTYSHGKGVRQIDLETGNTIEVYGSLRSASRKTGFDHTNIARACKGVWKQANGFAWEFV